MRKTNSHLSDAVQLRQRAETLLEGKPPARRTEADTHRLLHELQVHQIELEMQNTELLEARGKVEALLQTDTELYDFAPIGYFSVDERGHILEVNLTGAALLGIERTLLINRRLHGFVDPSDILSFSAFFKKIFTEPGKQICEMPLLNKRGIPFWTDMQAASADTLRSSRRWCRLAISDITSLKQETEVRRRAEVLAVANRELKVEITERKKVELALKKSEAHYAQLLDQSRHQQEQLRHLSHQLLLAQEEERKRISRELHDEIVQTLVGINVHLASLSVKGPVNLRELRKNITQTQHMVAKSVNIVHRFARELRPTVLDDLGLIPAVQSFIKEFTHRTKIKIHFTACTGVERLNNTKQTVLYRVVQSALANVAKHAKATRARVCISKLPQAIRLEIQDNGISFEADRVLFAKRHKRLGLLGSRERVEMVGGQFGIHSELGKGTIIHAEIPILGDSPRSKLKKPLRSHEKNNSQG